MATLDATTLSDLRSDLGDKTAPYAFSDAELQRNYDRSDSEYYDTLVLCIEQLLADAAKLYNYTAGYTKHEEEKVFDHLMKLRDLFLSKTGNQVKLIGLSLVPPKHKRRPRNTSVTSASQFWADRERHGS